MESQQSEDLKSASTVKRERETGESPLPQKSSRSFLAFDETNVRESGPLESNDPKQTPSKIEAAASMTQRNLELPQIAQAANTINVAGSDYHEGPEMIELPVEIVKSSRQVEHMNHSQEASSLVPKTSARYTVHTQSSKELHSPSPHF